MSLAHMDTSLENYCHYFHFHYWWIRPFIPQPCLSPCLGLRGKIALVQSLSRIRLFVTPWTEARQASLSITNSWSLLSLLSIASAMPSNHLIFCHSLLLLPSIFPVSGSFPMSQFFASGGQSIWTSASVLQMNIQDWFPFRLTGLISLQSKRSLSLLQHHSSKASIIQCSAFL